MIMIVRGEEQMKQLGIRIAAALRGGEVIELIGDVGAGKTTLTRGIAAGLGVDESVQSPTFTISRTYETPRHLILHHYDLYRLHEAGIMADELHEVSQQPQAVTIIEWSDVARDVLPADRLVITIDPVAEDESARQVTWRAGKSYQSIMEAMHVRAA